MNKEEISELAIAYIDHFSEAHIWDKDNVLIKRNNSDTDWASDKILDMTFDNPEELWDIILEILHRAPPIEVIEVLAAGPLEDYLSKLGPDVIDRVEKQASIDKKFKNLLGGVWKNDMTDEVWQRVQNVWDRLGWDGN